jgi:hypothetical protein
MTGYDSGARARWIETIRGARSIRMGVVVMAGRNPFLRLLVTAADLALSTGLRQRAKIELSTDIDEVLRKYNVPSLAR